MFVTLHYLTFRLLIALTTMQHKTITEPWRIDYSLGKAAKAVAAFLLTWVQS